MVLEIQTISYLFTEMKSVPMLVSLLRFFVGVKTAPEAIDQYEIKQECINIESVMGQESSNSSGNHNEHYFEVSPKLSRNYWENISFGPASPAPSTDIDVDIEASSDNADESSATDDLKISCARLISVENIRKEKEVGEVIIENVQDNKRKKTRRNCCPFCKPIKSVTNIGRHLVKHHEQEDEVKEYLSIMDEDLKIRKRKRWALADNIRKKGNYLYNLKVINKDIDDELLPVKRPANKEYQVTNLTHVVCSYCLGLFKRENLYLHVKKCKKNPNANKPSTSSESRARVLKTASHMLMPNLTLTNAETQMREKIFQSMTKDEISLAAQSDPLIIAFGARFFNNHREDHHRTYVSSKMRDLAKVLLAVKDRVSKINSFEDCLDPNNFSVLMDVIRDLGKFDDDTGHMGVPSYAPRLCSSLKTCAEILKSNIINDSAQITPVKNKKCRKIDGFLHLMASDWKSKISTNAEKTKKNKAVEKEDIVPSHKDIAIVCSEISKGYSQSKYNENTQSDISSENQNPKPGPSSSLPTTPSSTYMPESQVESSLDHLYQPTIDQEIHTSSCSSSPSPPKKLKKVHRTRWSCEEKEALYHHFGKYFVLNKAPGRKAILNVVQNDTTFNGRTIAQVCTYVNNIVKGKTKIPTPVLRKIRQSLPL